jgi:UDP-2,4-diacetamido-2,4,6-trideoxy-beta-L-altropyranose hydrolase
MIQEKQKLFRVAESSKSKSHSFYFYVEGNETLGLGHFMRCTHFARRLAVDYHSRVHFLVSAESRTAAETLCPHEYTVIDCADTMRSKAVFTIDAITSPMQATLIVDVYALTREYFVQLRTLAPCMPVLLIDDAMKRFDFPLWGGCVPGRREAGQLRDDRYVSGIEYVVVRDDLLSYRNRVYEEKRTVSSVVLSMGGSDQEGQTVRFLRILMQISFLERIDIITGPFYTPDVALQQLAVTDIRVRVIPNPTDYAEIVTSVDCALCGGGISCLEMIACGTPVIALELADNQQNNLAFLAQERVGVVLGSYRDKDDDGFVQKLTSILGDFPRLVQNAQKGMRVIDGKGASRVATFFYKQAEVFHADQFDLDDVVDEYAASAVLADDYEKAKWGSHASMENRFKLVFKKCVWSSVDTWLDIGCGKGLLFDYVTARYKHAITMVGVDACADIIEQQKNNCDSHRFLLRHQNFLSHIAGEPFDLVTCIGVLHKCGIPLIKAIARLASLVELGGQVFFTTKNGAWREFEKEDLMPYAGHHWFSPQDIVLACEYAHLKVNDMGGFNPTENKVTKSVEDAHTVYVLAEKAVV